MISDLLDWLSEKGQEREDVRIEAEARLLDARRVEAEARLLDARRVEAEARLLDARHYYQLTGCVAQYASINTILWTIFSIFAAGHALLANTLMLILIEHNPKRSLAIAASLVGLGAALAWALLLVRTIGHLVWHRELVNRVEHALEIEKKHQMFPARRPPRDPLKPDSEGLGWRYGPPAKIVMVSVVVVTFAGWLCAFVYSFRLQTASERSGTAEPSSQDVVR